MLTSKSIKLKKLDIVRIPKNGELVNSIGLRKVSGHPDNTNPEHFTTPSNLKGTDNVEILQEGIAELNREANEALKPSESGEAKRSEGEETPFD